MGILEFGFGPLFVGPEGGEGFTRHEFMSGESVLGRYAAANVDERPEALEKRVAALEESHS